MADRNAHLADLALGQRVVAVVAGLRRQVEGDREAGLAAREVLAVERVGSLRRRVAGIGADQPGLVAGHVAGLLASRLPGIVVTHHSILALRPETDPLQRDRKIVV